MADITVTAASVRRGSGYTETTGLSGEAITAGQLVALDESDGYYYLSDCDHATTARRKITGVCLNNAAGAQQAITVQTAGIFTVGGTVAVGVIYIMSGNAGGIAPVTDVAASDTVSILGVGVTTGTIKLNIFNSETIYA